MDDPHTTPDLWSSRSRASSIISTGTKTSIGTLAHPQAQYPPHATETAQAGGIDVLLGGHRNFRITARPGSILSISSFDQPAPPYESVPTSTVDNAALSASSMPPVMPEPERDEPTSTSPPLRSERHAHFASPTPSPPVSPTLPSPPTLSQHYTHIVRTIDSNHRAELAALSASHTAALAATRNSIDAAYRVALRAKDAEIVHVQQSQGAAMARLQAEHVARVEGMERAWEERLERGEREAERRVQMARHEVEELWEGRWRERWVVGEKEMGRVREEGRREEGERWMGVLRGRLPEMGKLWEDVRAVVREERD